MQSNILHKDKGTKQILRLTACSQHFAKSLRDFANPQAIIQTYLLQIGAHLR